MRMTALEAEMLFWLTVIDSRIPSHEIHPIGRRQDTSGETDEPADHAQYRNVDRSS